MFETLKKTVNKVVSNTFNTKLKKNDIMAKAFKSWYTYAWNKFSDCWDVRFDYSLMYEIQRLNTEAQQSKNLIAKMVWKLGMHFKMGKEYIEDASWVNSLTTLFSDPHTGSFRSFKDKYYTNHFGSGMIIWYLANNWLWEPILQILDSRGIRQSFDKMWNVKQMRYNSTELDLSRVVKQITQYDPDSPWIGMSSYESIVYDAMSDREASKRNFYFFKNNAMPSVILTLDDEIENAEEMENAIKQFEEKFKGSEKSNWVLATWGIKEVRTIDISNKDIELLELKKFAVKKMWVIFWFDPRFLGYKDDANGSHAEYKLMASQSDKSMTDFADILEEFMMKATLMAFKAFPYSKIELINDQFVDIETKQELILKKVEKGLCTLKQGIFELWYTTKGLPEYMDTYVINTQWNSIDNIFKKADLDQKKTKKETKEVGKEVKTTEKEDKDEGKTKDKNEK